MTNTSTKKLSEPMIRLLNAAVKAPVHEYGNANQLKALAKRGLMQKVKGSWLLTEQGMDYLSANKKLVDVAYAEHFLRKGGYQIRHNVMMVDTVSFGSAEYQLRRQYYKRSFSDEVDAVADFMNRAIELARAEWRAGIAVAEIGLVG